MIDYETIKTNLGDLEEDKTLEALRQVITEGGDANLALEACQDGLEIVGQRFETGEYFIGDLIYSSEIMHEGLEILKPALSGSSGETVGKVVFCTVKGDVHDIGKNIVISLMETGGFEVVDLGVDVSPEQVVAAVKESGAGIVALSGVLTLATPSMKSTIDALGDAGLRDDVKVIIGGSPVTADVCSIVGADYWTKNPQEGLRACLGWAKAQ